MIEKKDNKTAKYLDADQVLHDAYIKKINAVRVAETVGFPVAAFMEEGNIKPFYIRYKNSVYSANVLDLVTR